MKKIFIEIIFLALTAIVVAIFTISLEQYQTKMKVEYFGF